VQQVEMQPPPRLDFTMGDKETRATLERAPLFADALDEQQIADLATYCNVLEFPRGHVLMRQGDPPGPMYIILEGAVSITVAHGGEEPQEVAVSASGDVVGEMSLMTGAHRNATATTLASLRVLEITKSGIEALLEKAPGLAERFSAILSARQRQLDEMADHAARRASQEKDILARMKAFFSQALRVAS
jgi:CRP-like cAMP-binding protein